MADNINAAGYELKPWWPYVRALMEGGGNVTVEQLNVTENGTYTAEAGKAYSPVVVNVPAVTSDFSTAEVTIVNNCASAVTFWCCIAVESPIPAIPATSEPNTPVDTSDSKTVNAILYKGNVNSFIEFTEQHSGTLSVSASGNAEVEDNNVYITGDCTITVSDSE